MTDALAEHLADPLAAGDHAEQPRDGVHVAVVDLEIDLEENTYGLEN